MKLELGKTYVSDAGQKVKIIKMRGNGSFLGDNGTHYSENGWYLGKPDDHASFTHNLIEELTPTTEPLPANLGEMILAAIDGKVVQQEISVAGNKRLQDLHGNTRDIIHFLLEYPNRVYRVKPEPIVQWLGVRMYKVPRIDTIGFMDRATLLDLDDIVKVLRIELDPDTLAVLAAKTESP